MAIKKNVKKTKVSLNPISIFRTSSLIPLLVLLIFLSFLVILTTNTKKGQLSLKPSAQGLVINNGAYELSVTNPTINITCQLLDPDCSYQANFTAKNRTGKPLYNTTMYAVSPKNTLIFLDFNGNPVINGQRTTTTKIIQPDELLTFNGLTLNQISVHPPYTLGTWISTFYIDGQTCPTCPTYGASSFSVTVNVIPRSPLPSNVPTFPPVPTTKPTTVPSCSLTSFLDQTGGATYTAQKLTTGWGVGLPLTYIPSQNGKLDKVDLFVSGVGAIQVKAFGSSASSEILSKNINNNAGQWLTFDFANEISVAKNQQYTVTFRAASGNVYVHRGNNWDWARRIYLRSCN